MTTTTTTTTTQAPWELKINVNNGDAFGFSIENANVMSVDWDDGNGIQSIPNGNRNPSVTYATGGEKIIKIYGGTCNNIIFNNNQSKLVEVLNAIPNFGITSFNNMFFYCTSLTTIPNGLFDNNVNVTTIHATFSNCTSLSTIPDGLFDNNVDVIYFIGTFSNCTSLSTIPDGLFDNNLKVTNFNSTFQFCTSLTIIPSGLFNYNVDVTHFSYTFFSCTSLTTIPSGLFDNNVHVTNFNSTFYNCTSLDQDARDTTSERPRLWERAGKPVYPASIDGAGFATGAHPTFRSCVPESWGGDGNVCEAPITTTPEPNPYLYENNGNGTCSITGWNTEIGGPVNQITTLNIPETIDELTVTDIGFAAFQGCIALTSLTISNSVKSIGVAAFDGCPSLENLSIGNSVESIGIRAFPICSNLTSLTIPNSVKNIGNYAFYGCPSLENLTIGNNVESIGLEAFGNCSTLTFAKFLGNAPTAFGENVFINAPEGFYIVYYDGTTGWTNPFGPNNYETKSITSKLCTSPELSSIIFFTDTVNAFIDVYELSGSSVYFSHEFSQWVKKSNQGLGNVIIKVGENRWLAQSSQGSLFITNPFSVSEIPNCPNQNNVFSNKVIPNTPTEINVGETIDVVNLFEPKAFKFYNNAQQTQDVGLANINLAGITYSIYRSPDNGILLFSNLAVNLQSLRVFGPHPNVGIYFRVYVIEQTPEYILFVMEPVSGPTPPSPNYYYYYGDNGQDACTVDLSDGLWDETYSAYGAPNAFQGVTFEQDFPQDAKLDWVCNLYLNNNENLTTFDGTGLSSSINTLDVSNCSLISFKYDQLIECNNLLINNNKLSTQALKNVLIKLNENNLSNATINISNNAGTVSNSEVFVQQLKNRNCIIIGTINATVRPTPQTYTFLDLTFKEKIVYLGLKSKGYNVSPTAIILNEFVKD